MEVIIIFYFACALTLDSALNSQNSSDDGGILFTLGLIIYTIYKLPSIENYILQHTSNYTYLIVIISMILTFLIPIIWSLSQKKHCSIFINLFLRFVIYIDLFCGVAIMVLFNYKLGSHLPSFIFNIEKVAYYGQSDGFFLSLFASIWYLIIKILDYVSIIALLPIVQSIVYLFFKKTKKSVLTY
ncbi:hypothetical protein [Clostridium botulinum]|uniref:hypothetical protein n=1 Tax=Clostridium botulinum TaxID=1491 RepID=UPI001C9A99A0|nr:hypothetical protein [Clostridium botulinum]MBY6809348.1 hypothetical protein [Clostridium botulinum]HBJ1656000.1 hypothetical protein [Clostridium botulinum]